MELYEVMRSTFSAREFTDEPVSDELLARILDNARFAPSGGNRQGWRVIVVRDPGTRTALAELGLTAARRYAAQVAAGESPWNPIDATRLSDDEIAQTAVPPFLYEPVASAPVVLVICVDLKLVAAFDQYVDRVGVVPGASVYPFVWNILLSARAEGLAGTITTLATTEEPQVQELLGIPRHVALAAVVPLGRPARQLTKLSRNAVETFATLERFGGEPLSG